MAAGATSGSHAIITTIVRRGNASTGDFSHRYALSWCTRCICWHSADRGANCTTWITARPILNELDALPAARLVGVFVGVRWVVVLDSHGLHIHEVWCTLERGFTTRPLNRSRRLALATTTPATDLDSHRRLRIVASAVGQGISPLESSHGITIDNPFNAIRVPVYGVCMSSCLWS